MASNNYEGFSDESLENAIGIKDAVQEIQRSTRELNNTLGVNANTFGTYFSKIQSSADAVAVIQEKARKSSKGTAAALQEQTKQLLVVKQLNIQIDQLYDRAASSSGSTKYNLERQARNLAEARDNAQELAKTYEKIADDSARLTGTGKFFDSIGALTEKIPLLGKFSTPFQKAAEASRKTAIDNAKIAKNKEQIGKLTQAELNGTANISKARLKLLGLDKIATGNNTAERAASLRAYQQTKAASQAGAGMKAASASFSQAGGFLGKAGWIGLLVTALQFIVELLIGAQEQTVKIARNMSVTTDSANAIRDSFNDIQNSAKETYISIESLMQAQSELTTQMQRAGIASESTLKAQTFLTERMKLSGEEAAIISARSEQIGENAERTVSAIMQQNVQDVKRGKSMTTQKQLLTQTAKVSGQIAASFGFSNKAIAEGIKKVNQFGLSLEQAAKVSESLLNFEDSLSSELESNHDTQ